MKQRIQVTSNGVADLWRLPCVKMLTKTGSGSFTAMFTNAPESPTVYDCILADEGDWLCEDESGMWYLEKGKKGGSR